MENSFSVSNTEKTFIVSIGWTDEINKDDKEKITGLVLDALKLWDNKKSAVDNLSQQGEQC